MVCESIDIIVRTYNKLFMTAWCLNALFEHTDIPFNLLIADNSDDLTPQYIEHLQKEYLNIRYMRPPEPVTCGNQIINFGVKNTTSDFFVFMTNSAVVEPGWLGAALDIMKNHDEVGAIGFKLLKRSGCIEHAGIAFTPGMAHHVNYGIDEAAQRHTYIKDVGIVGWALVLLRRSAIPEGGFREDEYVGWRGYDDIDNCLTMQQNGWKVLYCGLGSAYHYSLTTRMDGDLDKINEEVEQNRKYFIEKWGRLLSENTPNIL